MNNLISNDLLKQLDKVNNLTVHFLDRTEGVKNGTLYNVEPSYKFLIVIKETLQPDGSYKYETSEKKPFNMGNILLVNRYKSKTTNEWVEEKVPAFCINIKSSEQNEEGKVRYYSMLFRGTSFERLMTEIVECHSNGSTLDRSKALYSIIKDNGLTPSKFLEHLSEGNAIKFAQYKRNYNMNFVDTVYYNEKIIQTSEQTDTV